MRLDVDGRRVFAATAGTSFDSTMPAAIFLHGSGLDHSFWQSYLRFFDQCRYSVLVPDLPGHTGSEGPPLTSIEAMAEWLHEVLDVIGAADISLIAHSQGCLMALEYAARYGSAVKSMSLIASGIATPVNATLIDAARSDPEAAIRMMIDWSNGPPNQLQTDPAATNPAAFQMRKVLRGNVPDALAADLVACNAYQNGDTAVSSIRCPVQVILGDKDRMVSREPRLQLIEHLPDAELSVFENCGHMIPLERPDETCRLLGQFVARNNPAI